MAKTSDENFALFDQIYNDPKRRAHFRQYLTMTHASESLDFMLEVDKLSSLPFKDFRDRIEKLNNEFINESAPSQINISAPLRTQLTNLIKSYTETLELININEKRSKTEVEDQTKRLVSTRQQMMEALEKARLETRQLLVRQPLELSAPYRAYSEKLDAFRDEIVRQGLDGNEAALNKRKKAFEVDIIPYIDAGLPEGYQKHFERAYELAMMDSYLARKAPEAAKQSQSRFHTFFGLAQVDTNYNAMKQLRDTVKEIYTAAEGRRLSVHELEHLHDAYLQASRAHVGRNPGATWNLVQERYQAVGKELSTGAIKQKLAASRAVPEKDKKEDERPLRDSDVFRR